MSDIVLTFVIVLLIGLVMYLIHDHRIERSKLINALLAKKPEDMVNMTLADQTKIEVPKQQQEVEDLMDTADMSDEQFDKFIGIPHGKS